MVEHLTSMQAALGSIPCITRITETNLLKRTQEQIHNRNNGRRESFLTLGNRFRYSDDLQSR